MIAISFSVPSENPGFKAQPGRCQVWLLGIGMPAAEMAFERYVKKNPPKLLLISGSAGALHPEYRVGDVFLCDNVSDPETVLELKRAGWNAPPAAQLHTATCVVSTVEEKAILRRESGADLVDMESQRLKELASFYQIPAITVRAVSDDSQGNFPMPHSILYDQHQQRARPVALGAYLCTHPQLVVPFVKFLYNFCKARHSLREPLHQALRAASNYY